MKHFSLIETAFFLKNIEIFRDLELDILVALADKVHQDIFDENEIIFEEFDRANKIYFVALGSVSLLNEKDEEICQLGEEDFFGEEALFLHETRAYSSIAKTQSLLLSIQRSHFYMILNECPSVAIALLEIFSANLTNRHLKKNQESPS